jgi:hypothetical protein
MGACTGFIFAALLEFTLTNYMWRKGQKYSGSFSKKRFGFSPIATAATVAAGGLDPSMFSSMMAAGAVTGSMASEASKSYKVDVAEDRLPLTSPAHNLLKKRNIHQFQPTSVIKYDFDCCKYKCALRKLLKTLFSRGQKCIFSHFS